MVKHIVFFKLEDDSKQNKLFIKEKLLSMRNQIDVLKHIEVGINFTDSPRAYDLALITEFDSKDDLKVYATHPVHLPIVAYLKEINTKTKVVDYEY